MALEQNLDETKDFIDRAGDALSHSSKADIIVEIYQQRVITLKKYIVEFNNECVAISKPNCTVLVYKVPYSKIKNKKSSNLSILNRFIVYILWGQNDSGKDIVYVGKSKNGIDYRPTSHEDKHDKWDICYIITDLKENTILNDGTIQYIENKICNRINETKRFINKTSQTNTGTANTSDMFFSDDLLIEAYDMLYSLGLDLYYNECEACDNNYNSLTIMDEKEKVKIPTEIKQVYDEFLATVRSVNKDIYEEYRKFYVKFNLDGKTLFCIEPQKKTLMFLFNYPLSSIQTDVFDVEDVTEKGTHAPAQGRFYIQAGFNSNAVADIVNQIINL